MIIVGHRPVDSAPRDVLSSGGRHASIVFQVMAASQERFIYPSQAALTFEIRFRSETIEASHALNRSDARFATFYHSTCNPFYWSLTGDGGFDLKPGRNAADAIRDIFRNGREYAFECATAMMIVLYKALIEILPYERFNDVFNHIYLWDWQRHPYFPLRNASRVDRGIPGDIRYFKNPQVNPETPQWQGENAVDLSGGLYYGHGLGILSADQIIRELNQYRRSGADVSAWLMPGATRPDYPALFELSVGAASDRIRVAAGSSVYTF